ncbi:MAG: phosphatidate cytidylyltransferase [Bacteroidota bacterium]|nr:phosphatidate cytidylyltransferase [Bacteroidota bacterium]MDP4229048.1 phosphatidate cytidylyltransferase [Bacteroidota bacterium]MDP4235439.1 phosphatidate cytidylyltransferase [Bacteroidota bacterium]
MSNLLQRVLVGIIAIPIVLFIVLTRPVAFFALVVILSGLTVHEYYGLAKVKGYFPQGGVGIIFTMLIALSFGKFRIQSLLAPMGISVISPQFEMLGVLMMLGAVVILSVELFRNLPNPIEQTAITMFGAVYIGVGLGSMFGIHEYFTIKNLGAEQFDLFPPGYFIVVLLVSIWVGDSAAYFAGKAFGKHKISIRISPGKSWEGAVANFLGAIAVWVVAPLVLYRFSLLPLPHAIAIGAIAGVVGQFGDFGKSLLKRDAGVKDSSNLIPGHGGVLDRLDSIIFTAPIVLLYLWLAKV